MFANLPFSAYRSDSIPTAGSSGSAYSDKPISLQSVSSGHSKEDLKPTG